MSPTERPGRGKIIALHEGLAREFLLKWTLCACVVAKFPALLGGLALPVAFIWEISSPTRRDLG
jgi:hypothetical protein